MRTLSEYLSVDEEDELQEIMKRLDVEINILEKKLQTLLEEV